MVATKVFRVLAVGAVGLFGLVGALFVAGEGLSDPGGWKGVALTASWGVPMAALVLLALRRPETASRVLPWMLAAAGLLAVAEATSSLLDRNGPGAAIVMFVVAVPCGLLGLRKAAEAGALVLGAAGLQLLVVAAQYSRRSGDPGPSLGDALSDSTGVIVVPLLVCAGLLLLTALLERVASGHGHLHVLR